MQTFIWDYAETRGWKIDNDDVGNLYVTKGMAVNYPCVVAHMDTVHSIHKQGYIKAVEVGSDRITGINPVTMRQTGIGGDDKCGIYAALESLNHLDYCKAAFFVDEEIGCVGSYRCDIDFFFDTRFILQADRRGNSDFVNDICGPISSDEFCDAVRPYLTKYNFDFSHGMMTDVEALRNRDVGVSCANISAGYYNPHQDCEYISLKDLANTTNLMLQLFEELHDVYVYKHVYAPRQTAWNSAYGYSCEEISPQNNKPWWYDQFDSDVLPTPKTTAEDEADREAFLKNLQEKYGTDFTDDGEDETQIVVFEQREKKLSEMTDREWEAFMREEQEQEPTDDEWEAYMQQKELEANMSDEAWIAYNNKREEADNSDADEALSAELQRYDAWFTERGVHNPYV